MALKFSLYYQTPETCEYLKSIIQSSQDSVIVEDQGLDNLPEHVNSGTNVIFLEYLNDQPELDRWIKKTAADHRNPPIYLYLHEISTEKLWKALRFGVKECFTHPIRPEEFQEALDRLPICVAENEAPAKTKIITFLGGKGGVGITFLTANLAYLLAQQEQNQVLAVDLDLRYGQMVYFFDAKPQYTITEVIENVEHLDVSYLKSLFFHWDKKLQLLPAPARLEEAEAVTPENLEKVLRFVKNLEMYSHVLVDAGHHLDEISIKALELADQVILVADQSVPALSNTRKLLEIFELLGLGDIDLEIWMNSWDKHGDLSMEDVAKFLGRAVKGTVPLCAGEVKSSINEGIPLAKSAPNLSLCQELRGLAGHFSTGNELHPKSCSRWNNWLGFLKRSK
jgi:pilus assembly protein CpaE|uniref:AAA domain-containing protein n=1 Tax=Desulfobacca acetoxidans TaxID=60893 RepID=A0A7V6A225_9BACT